MKKLIYFLFLASFYSTIAQEQIFVCKGEGLYSRNTFGCALTFIGPAVPNLLDIALTPNGNLYGIGDQLYQINSQNGVATPLFSAFPDYLSVINSLVALDDTTLLFVSAQKLYSINLDTYAINLLGYIGYTSAGDLAFLDGHLYFTASSAIIKIILNSTNTAIEVVTQLNTTPITSMFGLIAMEHPSFDSNILLGFSADGAHEICPIDGTVQLRCYTSNIYGAAATPLPNQIPRPEICPQELGISEFVPETKIALAPNPILEHEDLEVRLPAEYYGPAILKIINLQGLVVFKTNITDKSPIKINLNAKHISSGMYVVEVAYDDFRSVGKLVVK